MPGYGFALMGEEHPPELLVEMAVQAEAAGFDFAMLSDHFQPWTSAQGHGSNVWPVLGSIAHATERIAVGTAVVCPTMRQHPAVVAHAAATTARLLPGRFLLGLGSGGMLNEHITGAPWPSARLRLEMLEEAVILMRRLWSGELVTHQGRHFTAVDAQLWGLPEAPPPVLLAASGVRAARLAGAQGDGLIATVPDSRLIQAFRTAGRKEAPAYGWISVCWGLHPDEALRTAHRHWPIAGLSGDLFQELRLPRHVEAATRHVRPQDMSEAVVTGPDVRRYTKRIREFLDAGFTHVWLHQIGPDQEGFLKFWQEEVRPCLP
ncbi:TIGR03557 family F420-dependent LLM class oxidoreductase [Streptomyces cellostaticus]|uniref:TIGR03557 family F420-dependent LLM class oxidoreductase n=1 Tax=Streptomyces cellostaticus TaxID=67285 RepID=UPI0020265DEE|nr:TIGR03557 family F420-dependent LLM class oxidoreductase [Streptomyces cellostaticus]